MLSWNIDEICQALQRDGHRITDQRRVILEIVIEHKKQFTANEILTAVQKQAPFIGRATVFRMLDLLARAGLARRVHETDGCHGYVLCDNASHHHHLVCSGCGSVVTVQECDLAEQTRELSRATNFRIDGHHLEYYGVCGACQSKLS